MTICIVLACAVPTGYDLFDDLREEIAQFVLNDICFANVSGYI